MIYILLQQHSKWWL